MNSASTARQAIPAYSHGNVYPHELQPAMQEALAILADIDFRFAAQREQLSCWAGPDSEKKSLAQAIDREHQRAREPYLQMLSELQRQMMTLMGYAKTH